MHFLDKMTYKFIYVNSYDFHVNLAAIMRFRKTQNPRSFGDRAAIAKAFWVLGDFSKRISPCSASVSIALW